MIMKHMGGFEELSHTYATAANNSFCLYVGAGANLLPPELKGMRQLPFQMYSWRDLVRAFYEKNIPHRTPSFEELAAKHMEDLASVATEIKNAASLTEEDVAIQVTEILYNKLVDLDKYHRIPRSLLGQAPTLYAAICFSSLIRQRRGKIWVFGRNPKVGSIITTNYDVYFAGGWTLFQAFKKFWTIQSPQSAVAPKTGQGTITFIHGIAPLKEGKRKSTIVFTKESYKAAYAPDGFAYQVMSEALHKYNVIFMGTSFGDEPLCLLLESCDPKRRHFAIVTEENALTASRLGVIPVLVQDFSQATTVLKDLYCTNLEPTEPERVGLGSTKAYWEQLVRGPRRRGF
jgi:hypothetical protein